MVTVRRLQAVIEADGITQFESQMGSAQSTLLSFKKTVGLTGGALAALGVAGFAVAVNEARKFQNSMVELEKVTNPETARKMSAAIKEMAQTIPIAQTGLADIAADAGRFGVAGPKNIRNFTEAVAKMATATDLNTQQAGEALAKLATITHTPISEVSNLGSAINELSNNFATSSSEIVDAMLRSSAAMSQFGLSQTDIAGFSAALNAVSESAERAGTRMRRLVQEISNPKKISDMARALGMTVSQYKAMQKNNPRELLMRMVEGFKEGGRTANILNKELSTTSRQALAGLSQNLDGLRRALGMSAEAFKENTSLQREFEAASKTLDSQLTLLLNSLRNVAINIGTMLLPAVTGVVRGIRNAVTAFSDLNNATGGVLGPALLFSTTLVGIVAAVSAFSGTIATVASAVVGVAAAFGTLMIPIIALTGAIIALHRIWTTNFAGIRSVVIGAIDVITDQLTIVFRKIKQVAGLIIGDLLGAFRVGTGGIEKQVAGMVATLNQVFFNWFINDFIVPIMNGLRRIEKLWIQHRAAVIGAIRNVVTQLRNAISGAISFIIGLWRRFGNDIIAIIKNRILLLVDIVRTALNLVMRIWKKHGDGVINTIRIFMEILRGIFNFLKTTILPIVLDFVGVMLKHWRRLTARVLSAWKQLKGPLTTVIMTIVDTIAMVFRELGPLIHRVVVGIRNVWRNQIKPLLPIAKRVFKGILNAAQTAFNTVKRVITTVVNTVSRIWNTRIQPMEHRTRTTFNRIKAIVSDVLRFIQNKIIRPVLNWINQQWNEHGTVIMKEARLTWNAIQKFINQATTKIRNIINKITNFVMRVWREHGQKLFNEARKTWNTIKGAIQGVINWLKPFINQAANFIRGIWNRFMKDMMTAATGAFNDMKQAISIAIDAISFIIRTTINAISTAWEMWGDELISIATFIFDTIKGTIEFIIDAIRTNIVFWLRLLRGDVDGALNEIKRFFTDTFNGIRGFLERWGGRLLDWVRGTFNAAKRDAMGALNGLKRDAINAVENMLSGMKRAASNWVDNFTQPFEDAKERVIGKFNDLKNTLIGNSIVPDMLSDIMTEVGGEWRPAFTSEFEAASAGAETAMAGLPNEVGLPTPGRGRRSRGGDMTHNTVNIDVTVPKGVDVDTAARTIADEVKSRNFN